MGKVLTSPDLFPWEDLQTVTSTSVRNPFPTREELGPKDGQLNGNWSLMPGHF